MIVGDRVLGSPGDFWGVNADVIGVHEIGVAALARDFTVGALAIHASGSSSGSGEQPIRPAIAEAADPAATLAVGEELIVTETTPEGWLWLPFADPPTLRAGHRPLAGLWAGQADQLTRLEGEPRDPDDGVSWSVTYAAAGLPTLPAAGGWSLKHRILLIGVEPWQAPEVPDALLAALPLDVASGVFARGGPVAGAVSAVAGWHYQHDDPPGPATAVVRTGGPLADLVGERIRVVANTAGGLRSVVVYVDDERPFDDELAAEDLSLSRVAFGRLAPWTSEALAVTVEVMG